MFLLNFRGMRHDKRSNFTGSERKNVVDHSAPIGANSTVNRTGELPYRKIIRKI